MLHLTRIAVPEWAEDFTVNIDEEFSQEEYRRLSARHAQTLSAVHQAVEQYVNDDEVASDDGLFPQRNRMTGEYYISQENYAVYTEQHPPHRGERQWRFSFFARCLEKRSLDSQTDSDYLGLDVLFLWEPAEQRITFGGVDASSI